MALVPVADRGLTRLPAETVTPSGGGPGKINEAQLLVGDHAPESLDFRPVSSRGGFMSLERLMELHEMGKVGAWRREGHSAELSEAKAETFGF